MLRARGVRRATHAAASRTGLVALLSADLAARPARHLLTRDLHRPEVVDVSDAERRRRAQAGDLVQGLERHKAADEGADGTQRRGRRGSPAALLDELVVERVRRAV